MTDDSEVFIWDSGALSLDFLNTRRFDQGRVHEGISTPRRLEMWLAQCGALPSGGSSFTASPPAARTLLLEGTRLRDEIQQAMHAFTSEAPIPLSSLHTINRVLDSSRVSLRLVSEDGTSSLSEHETGSELLTLLAPIATSAAELLAGADPHRVRQCASNTCVTWFLDSSKNGRRRWCSMARCGNRAKAKKHWDKQRAADAAERVEARAAQP